jgi:hypothetical protein
MIGSAFVAPIITATLPLSGGPTDGMQRLLRTADWDFDYSRRMRLQAVASHLLVRCSSYSSEVQQPQLPDRNLSSPMRQLITRL